MSRKRQLRDKKFSLLVLALFVLIFAGLGAYKLWFSSAAANTANVWVDTNGGSCSRNTSAAAYNDASACGSVTAAYSASSKGDTIRVRSGNYTQNQEFDYDSSKGDSGPVTTFLTDNGTVNFDGGLEFGNCNYNKGATYVTFDGGANKDFVVGRTAAPAELSVCLSDHITLSNFMFGHNMALNGGSGPNKTMYLNETSNLTISNSVIGPGCCGGNTGTPWPLYMPVYTPPSCTPPYDACLGPNPFSNMINHYNFTFDNNTLYGNSRSCPTFDATYSGSTGATCASIGATNCTDVDNCHGDCIHGFGFTAVHITNNRFLNCDVQGLFFETHQFGGTFESGDIIGNYFSEFQNDIAPPGATNWPSGQTGIGNHTIWPVMDGTGVVNVKFNTLEGQNAMDFGSAQNGYYGSNTINVYGNLGGKIVNDSPYTGCASAPSLTINYDYNIWATPTGGGGHGDCGSHVSTVADSAIDSWINHSTGALLLSTSQPNNYVASSVICTGSDRDGDALINPCDAGADQYLASSSPPPPQPPPPPPPPPTKPGDCNNDSHVDITDLSTLLTHFNQNYSSCDFNSDSVVNIFDLSTLLTNFGT